MKTKYTNEELVEQIKKNYSMRQVLINLGLKPSGGNYKTIKFKLEELNLNIDHFLGQRINLNKKFNGKRQRTLEEILIVGSAISSNALRKRLIIENILEFKCVFCNLTEWNKKPIPLELDHINGINNDNRIENLRLLCPNCHSQTDTYRGKNIKTKYFSNNCLDCNDAISSQRTYCIKCFKEKQYKGLITENLIPNKIKPIKNCSNCNKEFNENSDKCKKCRRIFCIRTKIEWPTKEELEKLVWEFPTETVGKNLGVTGKAVEKRCKKLHILKPPRGYWQKNGSVSGICTHTVGFLKPLSPAVGL